MPDKLTKKKKSPRNSTLMSFHDEDSFRDSDDKVTYVSTNKKTGTEFVGSAPPNSRLAATLAQVAAAVQADNLPRYRDGPARLTSSTSPRRQIQAAPTPAPASASHWNEETDNPPSRAYATEYRDDRAGYEQTRGVSDIREQNYPRDQERPAYSLPLVSQQQSVGGYSAATRHELDQKVAYHTKSSSGELYVSAPTGSNEAQLFDEMARRMSRSNQRRSSSKGKEKVNSSKSRGWLLGW